VQSPEVSINELESAIDRFLINFLGKLKSMSREDFNQQKEAVLARLQEKPKSLAEHSARFWASIEIRDYSFNRRKKLMMEIKELTYNEALEMYDYIMVKSGYSLQVDSSSGALINKKEFEKDRLIFSLPPHKLKNKN
jgi:secreted Zn-dependent insulinase-like peptidase